MTSIRIRYDGTGRSEITWWPLVVRIALIVVAILIALDLVVWLLTNTGGTVPGSGEGDPLRSP